MAKYTTGEAAKLCGVTVRTVQYYDARDILKPSELSEGGRRLYSGADIRRLRIICFLREAGLSINSISDLLSESDPGSVINTLLDDILSTGCDILTIGQYLQPSEQHYPLARYATPEDFARYKKIALKKGFRHVASAPLARSSYKAWEVLEESHDLY